MHYVVLAVTPPRTGDPGVAHELDTSFDPDVFELPLNELRGGPMLRRRKGDAVREAQSPTVLLPDAVGPHPPAGRIEHVRGTVWIE